jgi:23S rRNA (guanosine2251-2'-O)-methyltransferase
MEREIIYGINPVIEALKAERLTLNKILIAEGKESPALRTLQQLAREKGIPLHRCPRELLNKETGSEHHQGVLAYQAGTAYASWEDLERRIGQASGFAVVLILDSIEDPQNLGSLIRTAEACGVQGIIIPKDRAVGLTPTVVKTSAGAAAHLPIVRVTNLAQTIDDLKKKGFWVVGAEAHGAKSLYEIRYECRPAARQRREGDPPAPAQEMRLYRLDSHEGENLFPEYGHGRRRGPLRDSPAADAENRISARVRANCRF